MKTATATAIAIWALLPAPAGAEYEPRTLIIRSVVVESHPPSMGSWIDHPHSDYPRIGDELYAEMICDQRACNGVITIGRYRDNDHVFFRPESNIWAISRMSQYCELDPEQADCITRFLFPWAGKPTQQEMPIDASFQPYPFRIAPVTVEEHVVGDSNMDGLFDSADMVHVFTLGQYEDGIPQNSSFVSGDWHPDWEFDSRDFVAAFQLGQYEASAQSVPEPAGAVLGIQLALLLPMLRRFRVRRY